VALNVSTLKAEPNLYTPEMAALTEVVPQTELETLFKFELQSGNPLGHQPGQFVQVSCLGIGEAPISVSSMPCPEPTFDLCVRNVGNVTAALHNMTAGDAVGIRGPFGHGFPIDALKGKDLLFVAGGIGLVPVRSLIQMVLANRDEYAAVTILYGFKTPGEMLFRDEIAQWQEREDVDLRLTVDKPHSDWDGHVGVITTLFPELEIQPDRTKAIVVGPPIMYRFVLQECKLKGIGDDDIILSLERRMRCGVGKCGHCQINNKYVCQDGPVFTYNDIKFMWEAI